MKLIAQDGFIQNLFLTSSDSEERKDIFAFLKEDFEGYDLICDFKDQSEFESAMLENPLWEILMDKIDTIEYEVLLENKITQDDFYDKIGEYNIFLINSNSTDCKILTKERGYLYINDENIESTWKIIMEMRKGIPYKVTNSTIVPEIQRFNSWTRFNQIITPISSMIIFDNYILKDQDNQKIRNNLLPLLEVLMANSHTRKPLTLTIITQPSPGQCIMHLRGIINAHLISKGILNVQINIIKHFKRFYPANFEGLHSRYILTNYLRIKSEDSFNYFKANGKVNNDADVHVDFCFDKKSKFLYQKELIDIKKYINRINNDPNNPEDDFKIIFHPNKINHLLN